MSWNIKSNNNKSQAKCNFYWRYHITQANHLVFKFNFIGTALIVVILPNFMLLYRLFNILGTSYKISYTIKSVMMLSK